MVPGCPTARSIGSQATWQATLANVTIRYESFYDDRTPGGQEGRRAGAIVRQVEDGVLRTLVCFQIADGLLVHHVSEMHYLQNAFAWTSFTHDEFETGVHVRVDRAEMVSRFGSGTVPGYAEYLLLQPLLRGACRSVQAHLIHEAAPDDAPVAAVLSLAASAPEEIVLPDGSARTAHRVDVVVDGCLTNRHWLDPRWTTDPAGTVDAAGAGDGDTVPQLLASDWGGAMSFREPSMESLLVGLDPHVQDILTAFD